MFEHTRLPIEVDLKRNWQKHPYFCFYIQQREVVIIFEKEQMQKNFGIQFMQNMCSFTAKQISIVTFLFHNVWLIILWQNGNRHQNHRDEPFSHGKRYISLLTTYYYSNIPFVSHTGKIVDNLVYQDVWLLVWQFDWMMKSCISLGIDNLLMLVVYGISNPSGFVYSFGHFSRFSVFGLEAHRILWLYVWQSANL